MLPVGLIRALLFRFRILGGDTEAGQPSNCAFITAGLAVAVSISPRRVRGASRPEGKRSIVGYLVAEWFCANTSPSRLGSPKGIPGLRDSILLFLLAAEARRAGCQCRLTSRQRFGSWRRRPIACITAHIPPRLATPSSVVPLPHPRQQRESTRLSIAVTRPKYPFNTARICSKKAAKPSIALQTSAGRVCCA